MFTWSYKAFYIEMCIKCQIILVSGKLAKWIFYSENGYYHNNPNSNMFILRASSMFTDLHEHRSFLYLSSSILF